MENNNAGGKIAACVILIGYFCLLYFWIRNNKVPADQPISEVTTFCYDAKKDCMSAVTEQYHVSRIYPVVFTADTGGFHTMQYIQLLKDSVAIKGDTVLLVTKLSQWMLELGNRQRQEVVFIYDTDTVRVRAPDTVRISIFHPQINWAAVWNR